MHLQRFEQHPYSREQRQLRQWTRPATPAERLKVRWFLIGAFVTWALNILIAMWVVAGGAP